MTRLLGKANEVPIIINGEETTCLVDTRVTVTVVDKAYGKKTGLEVWPL